MEVRGDELRVTSDGKGSSVVIRNEVRGTRNDASVSGCFPNAQRTTRNAAFPRHKTQNLRSRRGITLVEVLMASLIIGVAVAGLFSLWGVCDLSIRDTGEINNAGQIARQEIERIKAYGAQNFPVGTNTPCGSSNSTPWTGSYDPTANSGAGGWVQNETSYYDYQGNRKASATGAEISLSETVTDSGDLLGPCNIASNVQSYLVINTTKRYAVVTVTRLRDSSVLFTSATEMVIGGI